MSKVIAVFSDGTGNSAAKLFKTNVWRMYQALDRADPTPAQIAKGDLKQIAYYDDGVGTSSFKPLALLGGAIGWGLKRNVLDLYRFLCRNYEPGDRIYAFGFSRGAFTIRVLIGLVVRRGLVQCKTDEELNRYSAEAYRLYRRNFGKNKRHLAMLLRGIHDLVRGRRRVVGSRTDRRLQRDQKPKPYAAIRKVRPKEIAFIGVWDTVSAYGLPMAELTRGIDKYVWPLSMPNYKLSPRVQKACHALALDDERDTFHPLLWNELAERTYIAKGLVKAGRLQQVWFAGMHSDVGGGYPDDGLSHMPLDWMMTEASAAGLRFMPHAVAEVKRGAAASGPIHDSRRGLGGYYRYQPRKIAAKVDPPDQTTLIMRDPDLKDRGLLTSVKIHASVLDRIQSQQHGYAPIVLPDVYQVVGAGQLAAGSPAAVAGSRAARQEWVWNDVWRRRVTYFATVGVSIALVILAAVNALDVQTACAGYLCALAPVIESIAAFLPGFLETWLKGLAQTPHWTAAGFLALYFLLRRGAALQTRIQDGSAELWAQALTPAGAPAPRATTAAGRSAGAPQDVIHRLRTGNAYLHIFQHLKWRLIPAVFGCAVLGAIGVGLLVVPLAFYRGMLAWDESHNRYCTGEWSAGQTEFATSSLCWPAGPPVTEGKRYRVVLTVREGWADDTFPARPQAPTVEQMPRWLKFGSIPLRRYLNEPLFQPMVRIVSGSEGDTQALDMRLCDCGPSTYTAEFVAPRDGKPFLFVNDAILSWDGRTTKFYENNRGGATVRIEPVD